MKINKESLLYALQIVLRVIPRSPNLAILGNVMIDGPGQRIYGTDLEMTAIVPVEILNYTRSENIEVEPPPDDYLDGLKKPQLESLADDFGIEIPEKGKVKEIFDAIWAAMKAAVAAESGPREIVESYCLHARDLQAIATLEEDVVEIRASGEKAEPCLHGRERLSGNPGA